MVKVHLFRQAKDKKLRLWRTYTPAANGLSEDKKQFKAKVVVVAMSDSLIVEKEDGTEQKIHLSSVRLPRYVRVSCFWFLGSFRSVD